MAYVFLLTGCFFSLLCRLCLLRIAGCDERGRPLCMENDDVVETPNIADQKYSGVCGLIVIKARIWHPDVHQCPGTGARRTIQAGLACIVALCVSRRMNGRAGRKGGYVSVSVFGRQPTQDPTTLLLQPKSRTSSLHSR